MGDDPILTVRELARELRISESKLRRLAAQNRVPCIRIDGCLRFRASDIQRWLDGLAGKDAA